MDKQFRVENWSTCYQWNDGISNEYQTMNIKWVNSLNFIHKKNIFTIHKIYQISNTFVVLWISVSISERTFLYMLLNEKFRHFNDFEDVLFLDFYLCKGFEVFAFYSLTSSFINILFIFSGWATMCQLEQTDTACQFYFVLWKLVPRLSIVHCGRVLQSLQESWLFNAYWIGSIWKCLCEYHLYYQSVLVSDLNISSYCLGCLQNT